MKKVSLLMLAVSMIGIFIPISGVEAQTITSLPDKIAIKIARDESTTSEVSLRARELISLIGLRRGTKILLPVNVGVRGSSPANQLRSVTRSLGGEKKGKLIQLAGKEVTRIGAVTLGSMKKIHTISGRRLIIEQLAE